MRDFLFVNFIIFASGRTNGLRGWLALGVFLMRPQLLHGCHTTGMATDREGEVNFVICVGADGWDVLGK